METLAAVGLVGVGLVVGMVVARWWRAREGTEAALLQQQLVEMRNALAGLTDQQRAVPEAMAQGRAQQAVELNRLFTELAGSLNERLGATERQVDDRLAETGATVVDVRERLHRLAEATDRLENIGSTVAEVQDLLKVPHVRGAVGEVWLEELLRQIFPEDLFTMQYNFADGERVDAVLHLGGRLVPVDAKFPMLDRERTGSSGADRFFKSVRSRIDEVARYIRPAEGTFEFALMYVPAERVYYELVTHADEPASLVEYALARRVIPVSPHTFYAYLIVILHGLRGLEVERNAREIMAGLNDVLATLEQGNRAREIGQRHLEHALRQHREVGARLTEVTERVEGLCVPKVSAWEPSGLPK